MLSRFWKLFCYALGVAVLGFVLVQSWFLMHILYWNHWSPASTSFMESRLAKLRETNPKAELKYLWVDYAKISTQAKRAIIAAEDMKFVDHEGFDWDGIQRAIEKNQKKGKAVAGGSTITQQLAKNLFLSGERSYLRKGQEAVITLMLEAVMDKRAVPQRGGVGRGRVRHRSRGAPLLRRQRGIARPRAGGAPGGHAAAAAVLRPQSRVGVSVGIYRKDSGPHGGCATALRRRRVRPEG